ncbi:MAG TPA: AsmA family protein [Steroidobacteraceae bacterium]|jgi:AsmA protein
MRPWKIAAYIAGGLIAAIVVAFALIVMFVDPNDYRDRIAAVVEQQTGRKLILSGDLKLSVFPWLALQTGAASLSDAPGFGTEPFVAIQESRMGVRLLPLLRGKLEVGELRLVGARVHLITDAQGRDNWADLGKNKAPSPTEPGNSAAPQLPTIAGLQIKDAAISMENRQTRSQRAIREFNLETGRLESGRPFSLTSDFVLDQGAELSVKVHVSTTVTADLERNTHHLANPEIDVTVSGQGYPADGIPVQIRAKSLTVDIGHETNQLDGLAVTTTWKGDGLPVAGVPVALHAESLQANLAAQTLALTGLQAEVAGANLSGTLQGTEIVDAPHISGPLRLEPISLREWLPKLGIKLPATRDPAVFGKLSFASKVNLTKTSAELAEVTLQLDDTTAKGSVGVADFASKALRFDLDVDRIDADRYLAPPAAGAPAKTEGKQPPTEIPVEALRNLNARGQLQVGEAIFSGIKFTKLRLGVNSRDGKLRLNPSEASMYGGTYRGDIGVDTTTDVARVSLDEHLSGIDFAPLFKDLFKTSRVSGRGNANIKVSGAGRNTDELVKTLDGNVNFSVADGALEGADLWYEIRRARALLKQQAVPDRTGPERTTFTSLRGTGAMKDGVLSNDDLNVAMQYLKVTGQGTVDIPKNGIDYRLVASVVRIPQEGADTAQMQDMVDAQIPVKVTGSLTAPKVRPDIEGYVKDRAKQELKKQQDKVEEKVKKKLGDKLKDLFGK